MSAGKGSDRWLWVAAFALLGLGALSVAGAAAGYFLWWKPRQQQAAAEAAEPQPVPALETSAAPTAPTPEPPSPEPMAAEPSATPDPASVDAPAPPAPSPRAAATRRPQPAAKPTPTPAPAARPAAGPRTGKLTIDVEVVQDLFAADAVDAMRFDVRLGEEVIGSIDVRFGARGVARQNGSGRAELSKLPLGDHELTLLGGPAAGGALRGSVRVHIEEAARARLMAKVRYLSATDREVRFR